MKDAEILKLVKALGGIREDAVAGEISSVTVEIKTKDGNVKKQVIAGQEIRKTLSMYQTFGNCVGFPASRDADFAAIRSVMNTPGPLLRDYLAGKLEWFYKYSYRPVVFYEMNNDKLCMKLPGTWEHKDKFYIVGDKKWKKERFDIELLICDKLRKQKDGRS